MRVIRNRGPDREADRAVTAAMPREAGDTGEPALRVRAPHRQFTFGRRDTCAPRYGEAVAAAEERGFPAIERSAGSRTVAYMGTTAAFAYAAPLNDARNGFDARYEAGMTVVVRAPRTLGVPVRWGKPPASYCLGDHPVQVSGKSCGLAQRVRKEGVPVFGVAVVTNRDEIVDALAPVYEATDVPFDPNSVGSVADVGSPASSDAACDALEAAFVGDAETRVEDAADLVRVTDRDRSLNRRT